jgi:alkanesulfonate monooxygenase SsuD/methylene tetrahydromethanopterin reductase-like flavin-dependent oxidoreductase (luciferase family)
MPQLTPVVVNVETMRIGFKTGQWGWSFDELERSWHAAEETGFDLLACFDHVTASPREAAAWDAPTLLAAMAARTARIGIAVRVLNVCLRHPFLLAAQLAVAQATSRGRLDVGLGAGSFWLARADHEILGIAFPPPEDRTKRLEAMCRVLPSLWRGERVTDKVLELSSAGLGPIDIDPPRLVAGGTSDSVMAIAARYCDAWNLSTPDPKKFQEARERLEETCLRVGRDQIAAEAQLWVRDLWPNPRSHLRAFEDAGAEALIMILDEERGPDEVWRLANTVLK